jgi:hypothetical protein
MVNTHILGPVRTDGTTRSSPEEKVVTPELIVGTPKRAAH